MEQPTKRSRKRKALLLLPLAVVPFLTLAFWSLGGGKGGVPDKGEPEGLNVHLPDPQLKESKGENKLSFYKAAEKDSLSVRRSLEGFSGQSPWLPAEGGSSYYDPAPYNDPLAGGTPDEKVYQRLEALTRRWQNPPAGRTAGPTAPPARVVPFLDSLPPLYAAPMPEDPQLEQLNAMMEKILDIQHPERVRSRGVAGEVPAGELPDIPPVPAWTSSLIGYAGGEDTADMGAYFFSLEGPSEIGNQAVPASVHGNQALGQGSAVKLRLMQALRVGDVEIPSGTFLFGKASRRDSRLQVEVSAVHYRQDIYPLQLAVYDLDGGEGIQVAEPAIREGKRAAEQTLQQLGLSSLDPSLKAQAASAGLQTARSLLSRNGREKKVLLRSGYRVLLKEKRKGALH